MCVVIRANRPQVFLSPSGSSRQRVFRFFLSSHWKEKERERERGSGSIIIIRLFRFPRVLQRVHLGACGIGLMVGWSALKCDMRLRESP